METALSTATDNLTQLTGERDQLTEQMKGLETSLDATGKELAVQQEANETARALNETLTQNLSETTAALDAERAENAVLQEQNEYLEQQAEDLSGQVDLAASRFQQKPVPFATAGVPKLSWFRTNLTNEGHPQLWLDMADKKGLRTLTLERTYLDADGQEHTDREEMGLGGAFEAIRYRTLTRPGEYRVKIVNVKGETYFSNVLILIEDVDGNGVSDTMTDAYGEVTFLPYPTAFTGK